VVNLISCEPIQQSKQNITHCIHTATVT